MARYNRYDFFRRYLYHKADGTYTLEQILKSMRLEFLLDRLLQRLPHEIYLTSGNVSQVKRFLEANWQEVTAVYDRESKAAELYYKKVLGDSRNALAVDIGWAGSGAIALDYLVQKVWKLPCSITGAVAGTNSVHNFEVDASEIFCRMENSQHICMRSRSIETYGKNMIQTRMTISFLNCCSPRRHRSSLDLNWMKRAGRFRIYSERWMQIRRE